MNRLLIALVAHEINRAYCASLGDESQASWADAPQWQKDSALAGVDMHLANPDATPEQSHESWLAQKVADGWTYGEAKDVIEKKHPCCVPYAELPAEQKAKDYLFRAVVHQLKDIPDADEAVAEFIARMPAGQGAQPALLIGLVPVTYIGRRSEWHDRVYNTGLHFESGQTRNLPPDIARQFLRHADLFQKGQTAHAESTAQPQDDDTAALLEAGKQVKDDKIQALTQVQDLYDQIDQMGKDSLIEFASTKYRQTLSKRDSVATLRSQVRQYVDQFGAV